MLGNPIPEFGKNVTCGILNPEALESVIQLKESGIPQKIGIRNSSSIDKESEI